MRSGARILLAAAAVAAAFVIATLFHYWEQRQFREDGRSQFVFSRTKTRLPYAPSRAVPGANGRRANRYGLIAPDDRQAGRVVLTMGTCTSLDLLGPLQRQLSAHPGGYAAWSTAKYHHCVRDVLVQLEEILERHFIPDMVVVELGTIFYRDIDYCAKDLYASGHDFHLERAFGYWSGGYADWLAFLWMKRWNQFDFAADTREVAAVATGKRVCRDAEVFAMAARTMPLFARDVDRLAALCRARGVRLVAMTPPVYLDGLTGRQAAVLEMFVAEILRAGERDGFPVADLYRAMRVSEAGWWAGEPYHLGEVAAEKAAAALHEAIRPLL